MVPEMRAWGVGGENAGPFNSYATKPFLEVTFSFN